LTRVVRCDSKTQPGHVYLRRRSIPKFRIAQIALSSRLWKPGINHYVVSAQNPLTCATLNALTCKFCSPARVAISYMPTAVEMSIR